MSTQPRAEGNNYVGKSILDGSYSGVFSQDVKELTDVSVTPFAYGWAVVAAREVVEERRVKTR